MPRAAAFVLVALFTLPALPAAAQNTGSERSETKQRLEALRQQIQASEQRLSETTEAERASEEQLRDLNRRIDERSELARLYQRRLEQIRRDEDSLRRSLQQQQHRLGRLKKEYKRRATHAYKYGRLHDLALILAARSINEMLVRVHYLRRFAQQRKDKLEGLRSANRRMKTQRRAVRRKRDSVRTLLQEADRERQRLSRLRQSRRSMVQELREQQKSIEENISQKRASEQQMQAQLERLAERARRTAAEEESDAPSPERRAAFERLTGSFEQNNGDLPWPAEGVVTEQYGMQTDPVHGTKTPNPGVMISTEPQKQVQAVFEGKVTKIDAIPDLGTIVFVRHGKYLSLYGNLSIVYVGKGQPVEAGSPVGRAGTDGEPRGAGVFFALFKNGTAFDPADWLRSR
jgi:septal ring factor EnvC (AmiA/AmiB activator)